MKHSFSPYDVVIAYMTFSEGTGGKRRPILLVKHSKKIYMGMKITSKYQSKSEKIKSHYYPIKDWRKAGLKKPSYVDIFNLMKLSESYIIKNNIRRIGHLTSYDNKHLRQFIKNKIR